MNRSGGASTRVPGDSAHTSRLVEGSALVTDHAADLLGSASATFDKNRTYRYRLTRVWDPSLPFAVFVMLNPSTADAFELDPTVRRCVGFARREGAGGLVIGNLFALRSTDPKALYRHADPVGEWNDMMLIDIARDAFATGAPLIAAWGTHGGLQKRGRLVCDLFRSVGVTPLRLGWMTNGGYPRHPLYVRGDCELMPHKGER